MYKRPRLPFDASTRPNTPITFLSTGNFMMTDAAAVGNPSSNLREHALAEQIPTYEMMPCGCAASTIRY